MITAENKQMYYQAMLDKNTQYEGVFFVGVKTTGVFCRPTCPARKPKFEHCEFFATAQQAMLAAFRPCQRCQPLAHPKQITELIRTLVNAVAANPERRWKDGDLRQLSIDPAAARRQFKKRFGMTFIEYARAQRMGLALQQIRAGQAIIDAQLTAGYESGSGFRDAFSRIMGTAPVLSGEQNILTAAWLDTLLGPMIAIANETALYLLEFVDRRGLEREIEQLRKRAKAAIIPGHTQPIQLIEHELAKYFAGELQQFTVPLAFLGSPFQQQVWAQLQQIPYGTTCSYASLAKAIGKPTACRAVARANGSNQLALIVPCHRVINSDGSLGGYAGGLARKNWLLAREQGRQT